MKIKKTLEKMALYGTLIASLTFSKCEKEPKGYGAVEGQVLIPKIRNSEIYYEALQGTNVKVLGTDLITKTDSEGKYFIDSIPAGKRKIEGNSKLELKSLKSGYDPNYDPQSEEVMIMNETISPVEVLQLSPSVGYPKQILHGKFYKTKDKKELIVGRELKLYMTWTNFEPVALSTGVGAGVVITNDEGNYAIHVGEKEYYFLRDVEERQLDVPFILYFLDGEGNTQKILSAWKDSLGIIKKDVCRVK